MVRAGFEGGGARLGPPELADVEKSVS